MTKVAAVDIGATSGRVMVAELSGAGIRLEQVTRFANRPQLRDGAWVWDAEGLYRDVLDGVATARYRGGLASCGIDTWAIDYGVVRDGELVGPVRAYRDPRHEAGVRRVENVLPWPDLYGIAGIQFMPINTIYQIAADDPQRIVPGATFLMVPDLLTWWATGTMATDVTNASSTGMLDARSRQWSPVVLDALGVPSSAFLAPDEPGAVRGEMRGAGVAGLPFIGVATHDTASAFVGTPIRDRDSALVISLGTWALIGAEVIGAEPSAAARDVNVTHELGVDGTVRVLRNVCGMWLLEECRRVWAGQDGAEPDIVALLAAADRAPALASLFDVDAPDLAAPGQGPDTISPHLDRPWDGSRGAVVRAILESLVLRLARRAREIESLLGTPRDRIHVVGGASRMEMVMQWLADATGKQVVAGPVEATALGNAVVQWRTLGAVASLEEARAILAALPEIRTYDPSGDRAMWDAAAARIGG